MLPPFLPLVMPVLASSLLAPPAPPVPCVHAPGPGARASGLVLEAEPLRLQTQGPPDCAWSWPDGGLSGWYAGAGGGLAYTRAIDNIEDDRLGDLGFNNASVDFDSSSWAGKVFVGYRFERPLSLEAGWVDLGQVDGDFRIPPPPPGVGGRFRQDSSGFFASAAWHFEETELWSFSGKLGAFLWESDLTVSMPGLPANQRHSSQSGLNPFFGFSAMRTLSERVGARFEYDRFYLDSDPTDLLTVGLFVKF